VLLRTSLNMKKQLLTGASLLSLAAVAPAYAAPPVYNWTGWYVGGNAGYSWGTANSTYSESGFNSNLPRLFSETEQLNGFIGGAQFGYNWQIGPACVVGLETDFQYSAERGSRSFSNSYDCEGTCTLSQTQSAKIDWFGTVRGRSGPIITNPLFANEPLWLYVTAGLAYGRVSASGTVSDTNCGCSWSYGGSGTNTGWTVGAGVEGVLLGSNAWTWKIEYLFIDLGSISGSGFDSADFGSVYSWSAHFTDNILRFGINYRIP